MAAKIAPQLKKVIDQLRTQADDMATAMEKGGQRPWINWKELGATKPDEFALREVFDRKVPSKDYLEARKSETSKSKECAVPKICSDLLAAFERDFKARRRRWPRRIATTIARMRAHGNTVGPLTAHTTGWLTRAFLKQEDTKASE